jgi:hypothetical protein
MVFNATFNTISVISTRLVLLMEETGVPEKNQLPVESVPITIKAVLSSPVHGEVYSMQHYVIKFVSDLRQVGGFLRVLNLTSLAKATRVGEKAMVFNNNSVISWRLVLLVEETRVLGENRRPVVGH